jgi:type II secretory pathway pseudopilin PulG
VLSISSLVIVVPVGVVAAIAIPNLMAARRAANEATTIKTLRTISMAEDTFFAKHQKYGTFSELADEGLLARDLMFESKSGYRYQISVVTRDEGEFLKGFDVVSVPKVYPSSGRRSFYLDETGVIRASDNQGQPGTRYDLPLGSYDDYPSTSPPSARYDRDID